MSWIPLVAFAWASLIALAVALGRAAGAAEETASHALAALRTEPPAVPDPEADPDRRAVAA